MDFHQREVRLLDAAKTGRDLAWLVGKTVQIYDQKFGKHFAGRVVAAEFCPCERNVGHDHLTFQIEGQGRDRLMRFGILDQDYGWHIPFGAFDNVADLSVSFH